MAPPTNDLSELRFRAGERRDAPAIRAVIGQVLDEYGIAQPRAGEDDDLDDVAASYAARGGSFQVLVAPNGEIVGCGGLFPLEAGEGHADAEIRRMWFLPSARGRGLGRKLLDDLLALARRRGFKRLRLETDSSLKEAIGLYRSAGFVPAPPCAASSRCNQAYALELE